jgi:hypothetical protein
MTMYCAVGELVHEWKTLKNPSGIHIKTVSYDGHHLILWVECRSSIRRVPDSI